MIRAALIAFCGMAIAASSTFSQGNLAWYFNNEHYTVTPSETIQVFATVTNSFEVPITIGGYSGSFSGELQKSYKYTFNPYEMLGTVPAMGVRSFEFGVLTPVGGFVSPGKYYSDPAWYDFGLGIQGSDNAFDIVVVPEPTVLEFAGIGMAVSSGRWVLRRYLLTSRMHRMPQ